MKTPAQMSRTAILVEGALMVAISYVLSLIPIYEMPLGGSVTLCSTLPIIIYSLRHNFKWALSVATVYGLLELLLGFKNVMYMKTLPTMILCALLDYVVAYACLALAGPIARRFSNGTVGITVAVISTGFLRFLCSFLSGILLWTEYVGEGYTVLSWSVVYNGAWALPNVAIVLVAALAVSRIPQLAINKKKAAG